MRAVVNKKIVFAVFDFPFRLSLVLFSCYIDSNVRYLKGVIYLQKKLFLKELTIIRQAQASPLRLIGAGLSLAIPLLTGFYLHNMMIGTFGALGSFVFLYYQPMPLTQVLKRLAITGCFFLVSFSLGILSTFVPWSIPFTIAMVSFAGRLVYRLYHITKPGAFFIILVTAMATSTRLTSTEILPVLASVFFGILCSIGLAILVNQLTFYNRTFTSQTAEAKLTFQERLLLDPASILESLHYAIILFFASYLSQSLNLGNSYWMTISCAAVLQGDNLRAIMQRNIQRIAGTIVGLVLAAIALNLPLSILQTILLLFALNIVVEFFMPRNYAIANFFTTPVSLLLSNLSNQQFIPNIISYRFLGILFGSMLGVAGAYILMKGLAFYNKAYHLHETLDNED